ncbi:aldehyde dehydrogenase (NAD+) [Roseovarius halotolerans]|uniref:Aldehyde dehydrogenase, thermostable n=1 Tax=Roseovarius halotolerans TaxID=505353 RepID=A0A1X6ZY45_9RHOB|nr:aldehyde dehydrogenase family protein [Roseovarius halotolerans]RKT27693.1 aldehyde dehydrogenase (NAD+) [Roseovarius halotolerans]SLN65021.1 Aldehyde dehydrogenase, thermostable [Roseovarius halotolerans]
MTKQNFIDGAWVSGVGETENINPSDLSDVVDVYAQADAGQAGDAIAAARSALPGWRAATPQARADALDFVGTELLARKEELGRLLSREEGKILAEGIGEVTRAGQVFKFYAQEALRVAGEFVPSIRAGVTADVRYEPVGVVGLITPWNFPVAIPAWKAAPALAYGNTVVLKPAELTPAMAWVLTEILSRSGIPNGVFNLVMGPGRVVGNTLCVSEDVNALSFTGSVATGQTVRETVAARAGKIQEEMGGKSPLIVLDDADIENAVGCAIGGSVISTGQRCTSNTRIIATPGIHDQLLEAMVRRTEALRAGHALDEASDLGPVVDARQLKVNENYLQIARDEGAEIMCGGQRVERDTEGFFMSPAVIGQADNQMRHVREEIFGPVVSLLKADDYDHALAIANDSDLALSSGICTRSLKHAEHFKAHSDSGMVMVNLPTAGVDYHVPFGGRKKSSYGSREQGRAAREFFTSSKTSYTLPV